MRSAIVPESPSVPVRSRLPTACDILSTWGVQRVHLYPRPCSADHRGTSLRTGRWEASRTGYGASRGELTDSQPPRVILSGAILARYPGATQHSRLRVSWGPPPERRRRGLGAVGRGGFVDGAAALDATANWRQTSGRWAATETHLLLGRLLGQRPDMDLTDLVRALVDGLSTSWAERTAPVAELSLLLPPVCSVALARVFDNPLRVELATIGDCVAVCYNPWTGAAVTVAEAGFVTKDSTAARLPPDEKLRCTALRPAQIHRRGRWTVGTQR